MAANKVTVSIVLVSLYEAATNAVNAPKFNHHPAGTDRASCLKLSSADPLG
jgi:hypothetical protein